MRGLTRTLILFILLFSFISLDIVADDKGDLQIYCQPKVKVFVNGRFKSKSSEDQNGFLLKNVKYGKYDIKLSKDNVDEVFILELEDSLLEYYSKKFTRIEDIAMLNDNKPNPNSPLKKDITHDVPPEMIYRVAPKHPKIYSPTGTKIEVKIFSKIGTDGLVIKSEIGKSSGSKQCDDAALNVASRNKFHPGIRYGQPAELWTYYIEKFTVDLNLRDSSDIVTMKEKTLKDFEFEDEGYIPASDEFVEVEVLPEMLHETKPDYPREALKKRYQGVVWLKVLINKQGKVLKAVIGKSSGYALLDDAALSVAKKNLFRPGIQNGKPVNVWVTYKVDFSLN